MESMNAEVKSQRFTVFLAYGGFQDNDPEFDFAPHLQDFIDQCAAKGWALTAWSPGWVNGALENREAAIAAGRLIERDESGRYIPLGVEKGETFRIGGIYRDGAGAVVRLAALTPNGDARAEFLDAGMWHHYGANRLSDGRYVLYADEPINKYHLQPGECNEQGEPIAPTFYARIEPAEKPVPSLGKLLREQMAKQATQVAAEPCATRDLKGAERAAKWATRKTAQDKDEADAAAKRAAEKDLGTARNPHPHWGVRAGAVKV